MEATSILIHYTYDSKLDFGIEKSQTIFLPCCMFLANWGCNSEWRRGNLQSQYHIKAYLVLLCAFRAVIRQDIKTPDISRKWGSHRIHLIRRNQPFSWDHYGIFGYSVEYMEWNLTFIFKNILMNVFLQK